MATTGVVITADVRFAAQSAKQQMRSLGMYVHAAAVDSAGIVEAFPHSYTAEALSVAERLLVAAATGVEGQWDGVGPLAVEVEYLRAAGRWYA